MVQIVENARRLPLGRPMPRLRATIMRPPTTDCVTPSSPIYLYNRQIRTPRIFSRRYPTGLALRKSEEAWSLPTTGR